MLSKGKMRLFRRRPSISEPQPLAIYPLQVKGSRDGRDCKSAAENERRILDDSNYQTVKALPALVLTNDSTDSPKSNKKGPFLRFIKAHLNGISACLSYPNIHTSTVFKDE